MPRPEDLPRLIMTMEVEGREPYTVVMNLGVFRKLYNLHAGKMRDTGETAFRMEATEELVEMGLKPAISNLLHARCVATWEEEAEAVRLMENATG